MRKNNNFIGIFDQLKTLEAQQFKSHISSSQYCLAYQLVLKYAKPSASVLDWGTGTGHFSYFLLNQGYQVSGLTIEDDCFLKKVMSANFPKKYTLVADSKAIKELPFKSSSYDVVVSIGVLEHVRESEGNEIDSLKEISRILKPGGFFICYHLPNKYSWIEAITKHLKNKHNHSYKYSRQDIQQLLMEVNFELVETRRYGLFPRLAFNRVPNISGFTKCFNSFDVLFSKIFNIFCQNHYFITQKH